MINFNLSEKIDNSFPFYLEEGTVLRDFENHTHDFTELVVVTEGESSHTIDGYEYKICAGDVFVINGRKAHSFSDAKSLTLYNLMFFEDVLFSSCDDLKKIAGFQALFYLEPYYRSDTGFRYRLKLGPSELSYVQYMLDILLNEYQSRKGGYISMMKSSFIGLIVYLSRIFAEVHDAEQNSIIGLSEAVVYIENHFTEPLSLEVLASLALMSPRQFDRVFKTIYGVTPFEYLNRLRLNRSCEELRAGGKSITEVAFDCGYTDANYFSRCFKRKFGFTPREVKKHLY